MNLASAGFYDGRPSTGWCPDFVIQGGDPKGDGSGGPGYTIQDEQVVGNYGRGTVAMARTSEAELGRVPVLHRAHDNVGTQLEQYRSYAIFGHVSSGMDVVDKIAAMPNNGRAQGNAAPPIQW